MDVQEMPEQTWDPSATRRMHQLDRGCWCEPEIVTVPPKSSVRDITNIGDHDAFIVKHNGAAEASDD